MDFEDELHAVVLQSLPQRSFAGLFPLLVFPLEPLFHTPDPTRMDLVQEGVVAPDDTTVSPGMLPHRPKAGEVVPDGHGRGIVDIRTVCARAAGHRGQWSTVPVGVEVDVDVPCRVAGDPREGAGQVVVVDMFDGDFEIEPVGAVGMVEEPADIRPQSSRATWGTAPWSPSGTLHVSTSVLPSCSSCSILGAIGVRAEMAISMYGPVVKIATPICGRSDFVLSRRSRAWARIHSPIRPLPS